MGFVPSAGAALKLAHGALHVVGLAERFEQRKLGLEEVDVLLGVFEYALEDLAADVVLGGLALLDAGDQGAPSGGLQAEVGVEAFEDRLADAQLVQVLQVGRPSRNRMRLIRTSACFISPIDSS